MQRPVLSLTEGNLLLLRERSEQGKSGLQNGVSEEFDSGFSEEQVHKDKPMLFLTISLMAASVLESLTKETTPCRHRGQAIEPGGP